MLLPKPALMISRLFILCLFTSLLNNCQQNKTETSEIQATSNENIATKVSESDSKLEDEQAAVVTPIKPLAENFPEDQLVQFADGELNGLCGNKYGCEEQRITPLGWSRDGKFAYFLEEANEAVQNTTIHFIVQDLSTDERVEQQTFKASEQAGYSEETDNYTVLSIWKRQEEAYRELIEKHKVQLGQGTDFLLLPALTDSISCSFFSRDKMRKNELFAIKEVAQHWLMVEDGKGAEKRIALQHMGQYDLILKTKPLGGFLSPFEQKVAIVDGLEKRGYEGPPNVLRLQVVGCDLTQGFE